MFASVRYSSKRKVTLVKTMTETTEGSKGERDTKGDLRMNMMEEFTDILTYLIWQQRGMTVLATVGICATNGANHYTW